VNADGILDIVFGQSGVVKIAYGGTNFTSMAPADVGSAPTGFTINLPPTLVFFKCFDMNGDTVQDLIFVENNVTTVELYVLYGRVGRSRPSFSFSTRSGDVGAASIFDGFSVLAGQGSIALDDFNADGITDVHWRGVNTYYDQQFVVLGEKGVRSVSRILLTSDTTNPRVKQLDGVRICSPRIDFDGDGQADLLLSYALGAVVVYNHTSGTLWDSSAPFNATALKYAHTNITGFSEKLGNSLLERPLRCFDTKPLDLNKDGASELVLDGFHGPVVVFGAARARHTPLIQVNCNGKDRSGSPPSAWPATNLPRGQG
jgi:hypothetical protein